VLRLLTEELGVDPARAFAAGFGEFRPVASNLTPEGRALNRRADIVLLYPNASLTSSPVERNTLPIEESFEEGPVTDATGSGATGAGTGTEATGSDGTGTTGNPASGGVGVDSE
jgi:hypothetical protein